MIFQTKMPANTYFAIGFGYTMLDTDMIIWQADPNEPEVKDIWATGYGKVEFDTDQNLETTFDCKVGNEWCEFTTRRAIDTGDDKQDMLVELDKNMMMCYSFRTEGFELEKHEGIGRFTLNFQSDGQVSGKNGLDLPWLSIHGWWMWAIWMPNGLLLLISKRYIQKYWKLMHYLHAIFGHIVLWITIRESINVYAHHNWLWKFKLNTIPDNTVALLSILVCISGQYTQSMMDYYKGDKPWSKTEKITMIGKVHRIFGYIMLFIGNLACGLGTENYVVNFMHRPDLIPSGFISLLVFCVLILLMEIAHRLKSRKSFMIIKTPAAGTKIRAKKTIKFYTPLELEKAVE